LRLQQTFYFSCSVVTSSQHAGLIVQWIILGAERYLPFSIWVGGIAMLGEHLIFLRNGWYIFGLSTAIEFIYDE